jgi:hypothetical protein
MQHPDEGMIHSWLDGALSADEAARVEAHVNDCPECAAAVAEARGFIAGASRILTALDNAPRGVIPATAPKKRVDPIVWRVAATLLVVAGGTFAVLRNGGQSAPGVTVYDAPDSAESSASAESAAVAKSAASPITIMGNPARPAGGSPQANTLSGKQPRAKVEALDKATTRGAIAGGNAQNVFTGKAVAKMGAADVSTATGNPAAAAAPPVVASAPAAPPPSQANPPAALLGRLTPRSANTADAGAPALRALTPAPAGSVAALDAASERQALKIVGTGRQIGARTTLYEVAPGDTVTLTEIMSVQLDGVVVTGASTTRTADQSAGKSAPAQATKSAAAPTVSVPDSQQIALQSASSAYAQSARARTENVQLSNGVTTISWTDPVTRNMMRLSGRMSPERLQQVKTKIERERAAEAAKKKP